MRSGASVFVAGEPSPQCGSLPGNPTDPRSPVRSLCAVFVDAGYLLTSSATLLTGTSFRSGIHVDHEKLITGIIAEAEALSGLPTLRLHWYDSAREGVPDFHQQRIGALAQVKLRLGRFGMSGEQKGVDIRIGLDLVGLARNRAADTFILVSGDDDLTEAVEEAQLLGVQVIVLAVPNAKGAEHGVARHLHRASDRLAILPEQTIRSAVRKSEVARPPASAPMPTPTGPTPPKPAAPPGPPPPPTPNDLLGRTPTPTPPPPDSVLVYSSGSASSGNAYIDQTLAVTPEQGEAIDQVVGNVVRRLIEQDDGAEIAQMKKQKPIIPNEVDKALLLDLSAELSEYDLPDPVRFELRERFWQVFDREVD